jgi:hypothetical protein
MCALCGQYHLPISEATWGTMGCGRGTRNQSLGPFGRQAGAAQRASQSPASPAGGMPAAPSTAALLPAPGALWPLRTLADAGKEQLQALRAVALCKLSGRLLLPGRLDCCNACLPTAMRNKA